MKVLAHRLRCGFLIFKTINFFCQYSGVTNGKNGTPVGHITAANSLHPPNIGGDDIGATGYSFVENKWCRFPN